MDGRSDLAGKPSTALFSPPVTGEGGRVKRRMESAVPLFPSHVAPAARRRFRNLEARRADHLGNGSRGAAAPKGAEREGERASSASLEWGRRGGGWRGACCQVARSAVSAKWTSRWTDRSTVERHLRSIKARGESPKSRRAKREREGRSAGEERKLRKSEASVRVRASQIARENGRESSGGELEGFFATGRRRDGGGCAARRGGARLIQSAGDFSSLIKAPCPAMDQSAAW